MSFNEYPADDFTNEAVAKHIFDLCESTTNKANKLKHRAVPFMMGASCGYFMNIVLNVAAVRHDAGCIQGEDDIKEMCREVCKAALEIWRNNPEFKKGVGSMHATAQIIVNAMKQSEQERTDWSGVGEWNSESD